MKLNLQYFGGRGSSGGKGSGSEADHKEYLKSVGSHSLDEYDEEVLNDSSVSHQTDKSVSYSATQVNDAIKQASKATKSYERGILKGSQQKLTNMLKQGNLSDSDRKRLQKSLNKVNNSLDEL